MQFTKSQSDAIAHTAGNLQLIACAGSGKTEVVARRVANLLTPVASGGAGMMPGNIVAFTFTERAAAELKDRIYERVESTLGSVIGLAEMYVGTIHGFCLELLKSESPNYLKYEVLNDVQQHLFVDRNSQRSGLTHSTTIDGVPLKRYTDTAKYCAALSILREDEIANPDELIGCSVAENLPTYESLLDEKGYLDYSAILSRAASELENDKELRARLAHRIQHVTVDEYQDVNPLQERIVRALSDLGAAVCVVGDDDQTIYQWRGSAVENILTFANRYPNVAQIRLEENFRSSEGIVSVAREFISQNAERLPKEMKETPAQEYEKGDLVAIGFESPQEEARYIAETCASLLGVAVLDGQEKRGIAWSDMAILCRSVKHIGSELKDALEAAGIPYLVAGMNNLFEQKEVEAARHLFYFMAGTVSAAELRAAWKSANLGIADSNLDAAIDAASNSKGQMEVAGIGQFKLYNLQRQFMAFLEAIELREELVPGERGEIVFYNLGKFSQVISDFESINFHSDPPRKYESFAGFLQYHASSAYPEGSQDNQYANPNAIRIMTIHQAKGMQWPVVFLPQIVRNRFPMKKQGGRTAWHLLPKDAFENQARYEGSLEDERRLFYVAMTRSQKFLHMTWSPTPGNKLAKQESEFFHDVLGSKFVKRMQQNYDARLKLTPTPRSAVANVVLSFSDIKYFFECPYQFKLRTLYGFNAPLHEALGYGKGLHDALAEVHKRVLNGGHASPDEAEELITRHLRTPYAYQALRDALHEAGKKVLAAYISKNQAEFANLELSEKVISVSLGDGVSVAGRIDLVKRLDTSEVSIVDLKSSDRAQAEDVTEAQLHVYAMGYEELTGKNADYVEIYELDVGKQKRRSVDEEMLDSIRGQVKNVAGALRANTLNVKPHVKTCGTCDFRRLCSACKA